MGFRQRHEWRWRKRHNDLSKGAGISLLVPFRADGPDRQEVWDWLKRYWKHELPQAQLIIGTDDGVPFSKTSAVNNAAKRARGDIFVILDADCYQPGYVILEAAFWIREARRWCEPMWFIPYRHFYRLTQETTRRVLDSNPHNPFRIPSPPLPSMVEDTSGSTHGHWFGALIQVFPREAWEIVGGMDPRFRGWGGEDVSFMRALDCLYTRHKSLDYDVTHLYHAKIGDKWPSRMWEGQEKPRENDHLASRYVAALGDPERMRRLVDEGFEDGWDRIG